MRTKKGVSLMQCATCGNELRGTEEFCGNCGTKIQYQKFCTNCGSQFEPGSMFCAKCGAPIAEEVDKKYARRPRVALTVRLAQAFEDIRRFNDFKGRSPRFNFYIAFLAVLLVTIIFIFLPFNRIPSIISVFLTYATLAISIRRMRDAGLPIAIAIVPHVLDVIATFYQRVSHSLDINTLDIINLVCFIILLIAGAKKSTPNYNS